MWDGKYFASAIESDYYLLACYRYIELNPVRAGMVAAPEDYHWTSYHYNAAGMPLKIIEPHQTYLALGQETQSRLTAYKALFSKPMSNEELLDIRSALSRNQLNRPQLKLVRPVPETIG